MKSKCDLEKIILEGWAGNTKRGNLGDFKCLRKALTAKPTEETEGWKEWWMGDQEAELRKMPDDQLEFGAWNLSPALFCRLVPELGKKKGPFLISYSTLRLSWGGIRCEHPQSASAHAVFLRRQQFPLWFPTFVFPQETR